MKKLLISLTLLGSITSYANSCFVSNVGLHGDHAPDRDETARQAELQGLFYDALSEIGYHKIDTTRLLTSFRL